MTFPDDSHKNKAFAWICGLVALLSAGMLVYSQIWSFAWDEGFHLLAAQLIHAGKKPYLDFFHPQTPLYAYWNAAWMSVFGQSWRMVHIVSTLLTTVAILIMAEFAFVRLDGSRWPPACGLATAFLIAVNPETLWYGTIGQPYGFGLLALVAAFRASIVAVGRKPAWAALAGFFAALAAAASLLTAVACPILLIWMLVHDRTGQRWKKCGAFLAAAVIPFGPVLWLFVQSPQRVFFNAIEYHLLYRAVAWPGATTQNVEVVMAWLDSSHGLLIILLGGIGLLFTIVHSQWETCLRSEIYLCAWLSAGLSAYLLIPHPTFQRYFIFVIPFASILASAGLHAIATRVGIPGHPLRLVAVLAFLVSAGLGKSLYDAGSGYRWTHVEDVARKVNQVTPPGGLLAADEPVYFLARRVPPPGMEHADAHKLQLPPAAAAELHVIPQAEVDARIKAGKFDTVAICDDEDRVKELGLPGPYRQKTENEDCSIFWDSSAH